MQTTEFLLNEVFYALLDLESQTLYRSIGIPSHSSLQQCLLYQWVLLVHKWSTDPTHKEIQLAQSC